MHTTSHLHTVRYPIRGLHCAACAANAERILRSLEGISAAEVSLPLGEVTITYTLECLSPEECAQALASAGYELVIPADRETTEARQAAQASQASKQVRRVYLALGLSLPIMLLSMIWMHEHWAMWLTYVLTTIVLLVCGRPFYIRAYRQVTGGGMGMDTLVALSTGIAYLYSSLNLLYPQLLRTLGQEPHLYFEASAMIIAFVLLGKYLEQRAGGKASAAIEALLDLQPSVVTRLETDGEQRICPINLLKAGERVLVHPGERVPIDGIVISGSSHVDESMLTGEATPIYKGIGAVVYAGTKSLDGALTIEASTEPTRTRLAQIIELVREAQSSKAPIQQLSDRVAAYFVAIILGIALATAALWLTMHGTAALGQALISAITVLIISCPCALGLATPLAIAVAIGTAAKRGILIRDAESLELAEQIDLIALDKTGTLTEGRPRLSHAEWWRPEARTELVSTLVAMERKSLHPHSLAILDAYMGEASPLSLDQWIYHAGRGIEAWHQGECYLSGSRLFIEEQEVDLEGTSAAIAEQGSTSGASLVYFASKTRGLIAVFVVEDTLKAGSATAVEQLKALDIRLYMLTGDQSSEAKRIAQTLGLDEAQAGCLPEDKVRIVRELQRQYRVAMVGDGINDSAALAQSNLSVAMGRGSEVAIKAAMVTILSNDLGKIPELITLSRRTMRIMRQNLFWACSYNLVAIPLSTGLLTPLVGYQMTPMWASIAMSISSLLVVFNSLRLRGALTSPASHF